jgi:hypothetical protein
MKIHVHWMNLMKNQIKQKFQSFKILKESVAKQKTHFGIFYICGIKPKYSYTIMYECEKSPLTHELSYMRLFNFFTLKFFSSKCYL